MTDCRGIRYPGSAALSVRCQGKQSMKHLPKVMLITGTLLLSTTILAEDAEQADAAVEEATQTMVADADSTMIDLGELLDAGALSDDELGSQRAREDIGIDQITINDQDQDGDVTDNVALGNTNGDNLIDGDAFSNSSGFLSTVQNTGNNVLIQNSTIINVSVETPAAD